MESSQNTARSTTSALLTHICIYYKVDYNNCIADFEWIKRPDYSQTAPMYVYPNSYPHARKCIALVLSALTGCKRALISRLVLFETAGPPLHGRGKSKLPALWLAMRAKVRCCASSCAASMSSVFSEQGRFFSRNGVLNGNELSTRMRKLKREAKTDGQTDPPYLPMRSSYKRIPMAQRSTA